MLRTRPTLAEINEIYIDESSQTKFTYLVLGGIIVPAEIRAAIEVGIMESRLPELPLGEAKWQKVSRAKLGAYTRLVDYFFDHANCRMVHYHSIVVDTGKVNNREFNHGSREIGFNKEIYQLAMKFRRLYGRFLHVYPDYRDTDQDTESLRLILNRGARKAGDRRDWPYRRCQFRHSDECLPIQLVDVLTGALAYRLNKHHEAPDASPAKVALSEHILKRARIANIYRDTPISGKFTVWHRQLLASPSPRLPK